jgi:hypothetical protein
VLQRGGVEAARIIAGGLLGVGCTDPGNTLETYASTASGIRASSDTLANIGIFQNSNNATGASLTMRKARGTRATPSAVNSGDTIGTVQFSAYGTGGNVVSSIASSVVAYTSATNISSNLTFGTSPSGSAAAVTRMTIDQAGNVGIANTTGTILGKLHVGSGTTAPVVTTPGLIVTGTTSEARLVVKESTVGAEWFVLPSTTQVSMGTVNAYNLEIKTTNATRLIVGSTGIVTVGATAGATANTLDVSTSGWGIKLYTAPGNGDPNTLDCYEEGTWTPVDRSGAALTFTAVSGTYTRIGRTVVAQCTLTYPSTANVSDASFSLPIAMATANTNFGGATIGFVGALAKNNVTALIKTGATPATDSRIALITYNGAGTVTNANMSLVTIAVSVCYNVA